MQRQLCAVRCAINAHRASRRNAAFGRRAHAFWENSVESLAKEVAVCAAQTEGGCTQKRQMLASNVLTSTSYVL